MIAFLRGKILGKGKDHIVLETMGGVGYEIKMPLLKLAQFSVGASLGLHTYLKVSDSALDLYGFESLDEKSFFELLLTVSGIGPKSAMNILALGNISQIRSAIARADITYLTAVQGLGKKTAERVVVELKSKIGSVLEEHGAHSEKESAVLGEVVDGLMALGYTKDEAKQKIKGIEVGTMTTSQVLKIALKK